MKLVQPCEVCLKVCAECASVPTVHCHFSLYHYLYLNILNLPCLLKVSDVSFYYQNFGATTLLTGTLGIITLLAGTLGTITLLAGILGTITLLAKSSAFDCVKLGSPGFVKYP